MCLSRMPSAAAEDEGMLRSGALPESVELLVRLRLSRKRMLTRAQRNLARVATVLRTRPDVGARRLAALQHEPSVYPELDALSPTDMALWTNRRWDWESNKWCI
mmetsp:Transcript_817/g.1346  ORF Transcript_817/g.1346 Transcript_817/m.1346 type:complete len:104 (-) Transcript_817:285-596(-)